MASELLLDLGGIDLSQVAISAEQIGSINPQCGPMRQLDHVIYMDFDDRVVVGVKHVRADEFWVPYHIPGRPLLPGVLMVEAAAQLSSVYFRLKSNEERFLGFTRCDETVFRGQVRPGDTLHLVARELNFRPRRLVSSVQGLVDGALVFESKITGMVL